MSGWHFGVLGPLEVRRAGVCCDVPRGRQQALLASLLLRAGETVPASTLLDQVWGDGADRSVLNVCVMRLRRSLRDDEHAVLRADGDGYRLAVDDTAVDLQQFRRLCREATEAAEQDDAVRERARLHEALALWRGEAFAGIDSTAARTELAPLLEEERLNAVERRVDADLRHGLPADLLPELRELVRLHPFRERLWSQLVLALHRSGRKSEALAAFRDVREMFAQEIGVEPGPELRDLHQRILNDDAAGGAHPAYVPLVPAQLPPLASGFTGRETELARLDELLADPSDGSRVVAITGPPGVGKTSLGLRWAAERVTGFPDGQLYVDLRGNADRSAACPVEALASFLRALGVAADEIPTDPDAAGAMYRSVTSRRRMLVMLDNAADAKQARPLLPGGPDCLAIVTSRDQLVGLVAQDGAQKLLVRTFEDDEAATLLAKLIGGERFEAEPEASAELARVCGNLPLALRVAGANLASRPERSVAEHVAELRCDDRLGALSVADDEQLAVRSAFRSSYANLPESAQTMFCVLGLFPGSAITGDLAAALLGCSTQDAARSLDQLRKAHLVEPLPDGRLRFHDLLRLFAGEVAAELAPEQRAAAVHRLYVYYAAAVERAARHLYPQSARLELSSEPPHVAMSFDDDTQAMTWLTAEQQNLVAVVLSAAALGEPLNGCRVASALRGYLMLRMDLVTWLTTSRASLAAARVAGDLSAEAAARMSLGDLHQYRSEFPAAAGHYERALALCRHIGWADGEGATHNNLGIALLEQGLLRPAVDHLRGAYELNRRSGWTAGEAMNLMNIGGIELQMGHTDRAAADLRRANRLHRRAGSRPGEAHSLSALGEVLAATGEYERAKAVLEQALTMQESLDDRTQIPFTLGYLANVHLRMGDPARATELATRAVEHDGAEIPDATVAATRVLASVDHAAGRIDRALERYREALRTARETHRMTYAHAATLLDVGRVHLDLGRHAAARHHADRAVAVCRRAGFAGLLTEAETLRADVLAACYREPRGWD